MAAVLDALAPYVKKLIVDMVEGEVSMLLGVSNEITKLEDNIENIKAFLGDAERRRITDHGVQRWVSKLKNAMYDATDIVDLCQLEADKRRGSKGGSSSKEKVPGCFQPLLFCLRNPVFAHEIGSRIKELNQRLDEIYKGATKFNFLANLNSYQDPRIRIVRCPKLEVLEAVPSLDTLALEDATMEVLPGYLQAVRPRLLDLACSNKLYESLSSPGCSEWSKISHIGKHDIDFLQD